MSDMEFDRIVSMLAWSFDGHALDHEMFLSICQHEQVYLGDGMLARLHEAAFMRNESIVRRQQLLRLVVSGPRNYYAYNPNDN